MAKRITNSVGETEAAGESFAAKIKNDIGEEPVWIAFCGGFGAGKTAFIRGMAKILTPSAEVRSPSYSLMNVYKGEFVTLFHLDLYRLDGHGDIYSIGYDDIFYEKNSVCVIEWSEHLPQNMIDPPYYMISIEGSGDEKREIEIKEMT